MKKHLILCLLFALFTGELAAQELITNVYGRSVRSLNGKWNAIVDLYDQGHRMEVYKNMSPQGNTDFYEYSFENGLPSPVFNQFFEIWNVEQIFSFEVLLGCVRPLTQSWTFPVDAPIACAKSFGVMFKRFMSVAIIVSFIFSSLTTNNKYVNLRILS